jgi:hypothetical protein
MRIWEQSIRRLLGSFETLSEEESDTVTEIPVSVMKPLQTKKVEIASMERGIHYDEIEDQLEYLRRRKVISLQE